MALALADSSIESLRALFLPSPSLHVGGERATTLPLGLPSIDAVLPEGGLLRGAVVEIASPHGLGRATSLALAACASAQLIARRRSGDARTVGAWCAFIDPWSTLHASGALAAGVDLSRLLVVRPPLDALARVAIRVASSHAFSVVAIDTASVPGAGFVGEKSPREKLARVNLDRWGTIIRRLALAVEHADTTVLLLTDSLAHRAMPLPVAMRIELERGPLGVSLRVAKDRRGRITSPAVVSFDRASLERASLDRAPTSLSVEKGAESRASPQIARQVIRQVFSGDASEAS